MVTMPLLALDAVVLDTETTGLDASKARIVQIGAVRIRHGALVPDDLFQTLVDPGVPIPAESTRIHGIDTQALAGAPAFPAAFGRLTDYAGNDLVAGHNIGFDMAVLKRECELAGLTAPVPRLLDTRLLGQICFPRLAGFTLDALAAHLGVEISGRHDAVADAKVTALVLLALVAPLKARGIRTVGEAEAACAKLTMALEEYQRAGWVEPVRPRTAPETVLQRIDSFPFRHRAADLMSRPPAVAPPETTLGAAAKLMAEKRISSLFVSADDTPLASDAGILTERDFLRQVAEHGAAALETPIGGMATRPLLAVDGAELIYRALGRMDRHRVRHLAVTDAGGRVIGALSARDLLRVRASDALLLGDAIAAATTVPALALAWSRMPEVARRLLAEGVPGREVAAVISHEIGSLTAWAAARAEAELGPPPAPYAILVLGSAGRGESLLAPDQDNAVVWADSAGAGADDWFARHGAIMTRVLDEVGIPLCKGQVMTTNPTWRGSLSAWRERVVQWASRNRPEDLLAVDIFFDFRPVHGDLPLANSLFEHAYAVAHRSPVLAKLLANELDDWSPPVGMFGGLKAEDGRLDLKRHGLFPAVAAARCLAMRHGFAERATPARLEAVRAAGLGAAQDLARISQAHGDVVDLLLRTQLDDVAAGKPPGNRVEIKALSRADTETAARVFKAYAHIATMVRDLLFATRAS